MSSYSFSTNRDEDNGTSEKEGIFSFLSFNAYKQEFNNAIDKIDKEVELSRYHSDTQIYTKGEKSDGYVQNSKARKFEYSYIESKPEPRLNVRTSGAYDRKHENGQLKPKPVFTPRQNTDSPRSPTSTVFLGYRDTGSRTSRQYFQELQERHPSSSVHSTLSSPSKPHHTACGRITRSVSEGIRVFRPNASPDSFSSTRKRSHLNLKPSAEAQSEPVVCTVGKVLFDPSTLKRSDLDSPERRRGNTGLKPESSLGSVLPRLGGAAGGGGGGGGSSNRELHQSIPGLRRRQQQQQQQQQGGGGKGGGGVREPSSPSFTTTTSWLGNGSLQDPETTAAAAQQYQEAFDEAKFPRQSYLSIESMAGPWNTPRMTQYSDFNMDELQTISQEKDEAFKLPEISKGSFSDKTAARNSQMLGALNPEESKGDSTPQGQQQVRGLSRGLSRASRNRSMGDLEGLHSRESRVPTVGGLSVHDTDQAAGVGGEGGGAFFSREDDLMSRGSEARQDLSRRPKSSESFALEVEVAAPRLPWSPAHAPQLGDRTQGDKAKQGNNHLPQHGSKGSRQNEGDLSPKGKSKNKKLVSKPQGKKSTHATHGIRKSIVPAELTSSYKVVKNRNGVTVVGPQKMNALGDVESLATVEDKFEDGFYYNYGVGLMEEMRIFMTSPNGPNCPGFNMSSTHRLSQHLAPLPPCLPHVPKKAVAHIDNPVLDQLPPEPQESRKGWKGVVCVQREVRRAGSGRNVDRVGSGRYGRISGTNRGVSGRKSRNQRYPDLRIAVQTREDRWQQQELHTQTYSKELPPIYDTIEES